MDRQHAAKKPGGARAKGVADEGLGSVGPYLEAALRPHEERAAVRHAPRAANGRPICLWSLRHGGCPHKKGRVCSRGSHAEMSAALDPEVELWLVRYGGQRVRNGVEQPVGAADEAVSEVARLRAEVQARKDERLLAGPLPGVRESTHPLGKALVEDLVDKKGPLLSAVEELAKEVPKRTGARHQRPRLLD